MKTQSHDESRNDLKVAEQAATWVAVAGSGPPDNPGLLAWLKQSPRHVEEFLLMSALYRDLDGMDPQRRIDVEAALENSASNVVSLRATADDAPANKHRPRGWFFAAAAVALCTVAATWWLLPELQRSRYSTGVGEQRVLELADGSVIHLNTGSRVSVRFTDTARDVRLLQGEALFKVAADAQRPFVVTADGAAIRALGTQFNVYKKENRTTVSVIEGLVQVSANAGSGAGETSVPSVSAGQSKRAFPASRDSEETSAPQDRDIRTLARDTAAETRDGGALSGAVLAAGQEVDVGRGGILRSANMDSVKVTAWRQRRLVFLDDKLTDVAREFNRYNVKPQIRVLDEAAGEKRLSGVFDADDPESLLLFMHGISELSVEVNADEVLIRLHAPQAASQPGTAL